MSKAKSKKEEALQFLDDLDFNVDDVPSSAQLAHEEDSQHASSPPSEANPQPEGVIGDKEADDALNFLNDLTLKRSSATIPRPSSVPPLSSSPSVPSLQSVSNPLSEAPTNVAPLPSTPANVPTSTASPSSSWGWSAPSLWGSASAAIQQAKSTAESLQREGTKAVQSAMGEVVSEVGGVDAKARAGLAVEEGKKWGGSLLSGFVKGVGQVDLEKLGHDLLTVSSSGLSNLLEKMAPPISEHEVIEIWLSHEMVGYDGVDGVVYRSLSKILEQVEGGELVVNKGRDDIPRSATGKKRDLNAVEGFEAAFQLAEASLKEMIDKHEGKPAYPSASGLPITVSPVFLRIQPVLAPLPFAEPSVISAPSSPQDPESIPIPNTPHLFFMILLSDPSHRLRSSTVTQAVPGSWLEVKYEEGEWVEDHLVDVLGKGIEVVGQDYVARRMGVLDTEPASVDVEKESAGSDPTGPKEA